MIVCRWHPPNHSRLVLNEADQRGSWRAYQVCSAAQALILQGAGVEGGGAGGTARTAAATRPAPRRDTTGLVLSARKHQAGQRRAAHKELGADSSILPALLELAAAGEVMLVPCFQLHRFIVDRCGPWTATADVIEALPLGIDRPHGGPSATAQFSFVELFAGIGGFRIALEALGGACVLASEIHPGALQLYDLNFRASGSEAAGMTAKGGAADVVKGTLVKLRGGRDVPAHDLLTAGFPCQPFTSGVGERRCFRDPRGQLFFHTARPPQRAPPRFCSVPRVWSACFSFRPALALRRSA